MICRVGCFGSCVGVDVQSTQHIYNCIKQLQMEGEVLSWLENVALLDLKATFKWLCGLSLSLQPAAN